MKLPWNEQDLGRRWCSIVLRYRRLVLLLILLMSVFLLPGIQRLELDSSNESFLPENDTQTLLNEKFKRIFGNEEFVFILAESEDEFTSRQLHELKRLQTRIENELPFVEETTSVLNGELLVSDGYMLNTFNPFEEDFPESTQEVESALDIFLDSSLYRDKLVSSDKRALGIYISFTRIPDTVWVDAAPGFDPLSQAHMQPEEVVRANRISYEATHGYVPVADPRKLIAPALKAIVASCELSSLQIHSTGMALLDYSVDVFTTSEAARFGLITLGITIVILLFLFRNLLALAGPLLAVLVTLLQLFGLIGYMGIPLSITSIIIVPLIFIISISYSIHIINHYRREYREAGDREVQYAALNAALAHAFWPCLLTALTTSIGFTSFLIVPMAPIRDLGITAAIGVMLTFVLVMLLLPILFSFSKGPIRGMRLQRHSKRGTAGAWGKWTNAVVRMKAPIIGLFILVSIVCAVAATRIPVETDFLQMMGSRIPIVEETRKITDRMGAIYSYELMVELPENGLAKDPDVLRALDSLAGTAKSFESVQNTMSIADMIRETKAVLTESNSETAALPETREEAAQYLLLYEMSGGEELDKWVDYDYRTVRLSVQLGLSAGIGDQLQIMKTKAEELFPEGSRIALVGDIPVLLRMMSLLVSGQIKSIAAAMLIISLVMVLVLRSMRGGLVSMLPNLFPVISILGVMGLLGLNLDMITVMIAPMIIGIAVDDTVHFFLHFRQELYAQRPESGEAGDAVAPYEAALHYTFERVGNALLFTSITLTAGFSVFAFSRAGSMIHFGILSGVGIAAALLADLVLSPALLMVLRPFRPESPGNDPPRAETLGAGPLQVVTLQIGPLQVGQDKSKSSKETKKE